MLRMMIQSLTERVLVIVEVRFIYLKNLGKSYLLKNKNSMKKVFY